MKTFLTGELACNICQIIKKKIIKVKRGES